jgi:uncharacterized protein YqeY
MGERLKQQILDDMKDAMRAGDKLRLGVVRMLKAEIQKQEVDLRATKGRDYALDDDEVLAVVSRAAKQRRESIASFRSGGREDLAAREEAELGILEAYLPRQLGPDEIRKLVDAAIAESGAASAHDMGKVMKVLMPKVKGRADGKLVNQVVKERLGS